MFVLRTRRYVQQLVMEDTTPTEEVEHALVMQQRRGFLRSAGLRLFRWFLQSTTLGSARREVLALVPVALADSADAAERGVPFQLAVPGCGAPLQAAIQCVFAR